MIKSIRHTGIVVRDLERASNFYRAIGFIDSNKAIEEGNFIDQVTGLKHTKLEWVKLEAPDGCLLELLHYHSHLESKEVTNQKSNKLGCSHLAFTVDDIKSACDKIRKAGGTVASLPATAPNGKAKVVYCHDPEGVLMEIVEELKSK
jgi:catechol 2,3-dioxygenase-like lactoylglutathione lyase family enzyme